MENTKKNLKKKLKHLIKKLNNSKKSTKFKNNKHFRAHFQLPKKRQANLMIENLENHQPKIKKMQVDLDKIMITFPMINKTNKETINSNPKMQIRNLNCKGMKKNKR